MSVTVEAGTVLREARPTRDDSGKRLLGGLRSAPWGLAVLAVAIGAGAGVGSIVFRWCIQTFTRLFSGHPDYAAAPGSANPHVSWLGPVSSSSCR